MKNVTKLACWVELEKLGFVKVNYRLNGRLNCVGASLMRAGTDTIGRIFNHDIITIEPSSGNLYHISGKVKTPYIDTFYYYDFAGRKTEQYRTVDFINNHYKAREILSVIRKMTN